MSNDTSIDNKHDLGAKYTFFEAFIVLLIIVTQTIDSSLLNAILGVSIFYYVREKLDVVVNKVESLSNCNVET